jgi:hypothetical protein
MGPQNLGCCDCMHVGEKTLFMGNRCDCANVCEVTLLDMCYVRCSILLLPVCKSRLHVHIITRMRPIRSRTAQLPVSAAAVPSCERPRTAMLIPRRFNAALAAIPSPTLPHESCFDAALAPE